MNLTKLKDGKRAEDLAVSYLESIGYKIIEKNYKTKLGEIDIIGKESGCICFVEVRSCYGKMSGLRGRGGKKDKRFFRFPARV